MAKRIDSAKVEQKTQEAIQVLKKLGFPRQQLNERSALTLLSLLDGHNANDGVFRRALWQAVRSKYT